ncbi:MAG: hypothetical protein ACREO5_12975, partial [Candidatus Binatia bacterium]
MTNQTLTNTVLSILRQPGIGQINFQLGALLVTGQKLAQVAQAIADGKIECLTVKELKAGPTGLAKGMVIEARYKEELNAMLFRDENYGTAAGEDRTIVHEAVHAMFDLTAPGLNFKTLSIDDESAAVLTEALYIKLCGKPLGGFKMVVDGPQDEAWRLAGLMSLATDNFTTGGGTFMLTPDQTEDLRKAVAVDWNFVKKPDKVGSGYTDDSTSQYVYN